MDELIESGENLRVRKPEVLFSRSHKKKRSERPVPGSDAVLKIGLACSGGQSIGSIKSVPLISRTKKCAYCGRARALYKCRSCLHHLCMIVPMANNGIRYPVNGTVCFQRFHGIINFPT